MRISPFDCHKNLKKCQCILNYFCMQVVKCNLEENNEGWWKYLHVVMSSLVELYNDMPFTYQKHAVHRKTMLKQKHCPCCWTTTTSHAHAGKQAFSSSPQNVTEEKICHELANWLKEVQNNTEKLNKFMSFMCHLIIIIL